VNTLLSAVELQVAERTRSEQRMREFLLDASHELRTPLTSIRGYAELARMQRHAGDQSTVGDTLDRIEAEGTRMSRLVDDLLSLARTDEGATLHTQFIEVDEVLADAVRSARAAYPERPINLAAAPGLVVSADHEQLHRAVLNLLANAAVHTNAGGPVGVRAYRADNDVIIQVTDSGPGIPPEQASRVFDRFWRADKARTRVRGGSGLGLSIVASIIRQHGGSVRFDSTVETGSTVTIRLPVPSTIGPFRT
jgi:two-component system OmpR family sensor kinase